MLQLKSNNKLYLFHLTLRPFQEFPAIFYHALANTCQKVFLSTNLTQSGSVCLLECPFRALERPKSVKTLWNNKIEAEHSCLHYL